jgi:plastocyanin
MALSAQRSRTLAGMGLLALALAACGSAGAGQPAPSSVSTAVATSAPTSAGADASGSGPAADALIQTFSFKPEVLEVRVGTTVRWNNKDAIDHTVTHGAPPALGGAFNSEFFDQGDTFIFTFTEAGDFPYFCRRHPSMVGMVRVIR